MIAMLDTSEDLTTAAQELGCPVEQLLTPLTRFRRKQLESKFAIDNGAFASFSKNDFLALLEREYEARNLCRFVAVPDVVGSAIRTLELFDFWESRLTHWPLALVAQDGQEHIGIPWNKIEAVFIGGTTEFKTGNGARQIIKAAKAMDIWVHVGRVNTPGRFEYFDELGVDSIDGTGLSRYTWMRKDIYEHYQKPRLFALSERPVGLVVEAKEEKSNG